MRGGVTPDRRGRWSWHASTPSDSEFVTDARWPPASRPACQIGQVLAGRKVATPLPRIHAARLARGASSPLEGCDPIPHAPRLARGASSPSKGATPSRGSGVPYRLRCLLTSRRVRPYAADPRALSRPRCLLLEGCDPIPRICAPHLARGASSPLEGATASRGFMPLTRPRCLLTPRRARPGRRSLMARRPRRSLPARAPSQ